MNDASDRAGAQVEPVVIPVEAYVSADYARAENDRLWAKVWQVACRLEEIPRVGDYVTYDILDESIVVVRSAKDRIKAFYNVCQHRGRRLAEGCGHTGQFVCRFHGWRWELSGENAFVLDREDWGAALTAENLRLKEVRVDTWGGFVWINMDPGCEPLLDYLKPAPPMLDPFEMEKMRYRWRQWLYFPCNWKTALEAFVESYHVDATHPQLIAWGSNRWWSKGEGKHAWHGIGAPRGETSRAGSGMNVVMAQAGQDPREAAWTYLDEVLRTVNATTTQTFVDVAKRLAAEMPAGTTGEELMARMMREAAQADAARGVIWPQIDAAHFAECGHDWHLFPNLVVLPAVTTALCYRARPHGYDPDSCIFEVFVLERFPPGGEPKTEWVFQPDPTEETWRLILSQDFFNMPQVQRGMKSRGFRGGRPSPVQEVAVSHFHQVLAQYMGTGAPTPIRPQASD